MVEAQVPEQINEIVIDENEEESDEQSLEGSLSIEFQHPNDD